MSERLRTPGVASVTGIETRPLPETCASPPVVWIRHDHVCYIGPDLGVDMHSAAVAVLSIGLDAPLTLETSGQGAITARSVYAPARAPHRVIAPEGRILLFFVEPAREQIAMPITFGARPSAERIPFTRREPQVPPFRNLSANPPAF